MPQSDRPSIAGAVALIVVGLVIFIPSGLCTGVMTIGPLIEGILNPNSAGAYGMLPLALMIGGPFVIGGAIMIWSGVSRLRASRRPPADRIPPG